MKTVWDLQRLKGDTKSGDAAMWQACQSAWNTIPADFFIINKTA